MKFGEKIKVLRLNNGLSQQDLACNLYVSRQTVTKWETGKSLPDIQKLKMLSEIFDISIDNLLSDVSFD
ncbi:MAG: helix-turn-helix transcriptional regulator [Ruminococcus sp.]|nr:helix-turn-helix transcriptional regulator [Ruminococcus sp.]